MNKTIYIVTEDYNNLNYRVKKIISLRYKYTIILIAKKTKNNVSQDINDILIKPYRNPFSIFRYLKLFKVEALLNKFFYFPSVLFLYIKKVEKYLIKEFNKSHHKDVILLTICPPHDISIIGLNMKKKYPNIKWINDLQDLWTYDKYYFNRLLSIKQSKALKYEKNIFKNCNQTILTNENVKEFIQDNYSQSINVDYIYHSFDKFNFEIIIINK